MIGNKPARCYHYEITSKTDVGEKGKEKQGEDAGKMHVEIKCFCEKSTPYCCFQGIRPMFFLSPSKNYV